jgi:hypothetical protein
MLLDDVWVQTTCDRNCHSDEVSDDRTVGEISAARDNVLMITRSNSRMTTGYGAQAYPGNMKNDCELWDKINTYE